MARDRSTKNTRMGQNIIKQEITHREVELDADFTPLTTDAAGRQIRSQYVIHRCVATVDQASRQLVAPGQTVIVERADPPVITVNGQPMSADDIDLLDLIVSTDPPRVTLDDAIFGTPQPQEVGASWPINVQNAAADLSGREMVVSPNDLQGQVQLVEVVPCSAGHCLSIVANLQATNIQLPGLPPGAVVTSSQLESRMEGLLPVDPSRPSEEGGRTQMNAHFEVAIPNSAPNLNVQVIMERDRQEAPQPQ
jgi:hypothetical protein